MVPRSLSTTQTELELLFSVATETLSEVHAITDEHPLAAVAAVYKPAGETDLGKRAVAPTAVSCRQVELPELDKQTRLSQLV